MDLNKLTYRSETKQSDLEGIEDVLASSGFFHPYEIKVAKELLEYRLEDGEKSGIDFLIAEDNGKVIGYISSSFNDCTISTHHLYWFAVHGDYRGKGVGSVLLARLEESIVAKGGKKIVLETSGREIYNPTRAFYLKKGYKETGMIPDYYAVGDPNITYVKDVG